MHRVKAGIQRVCDRPAQRSDLPRFAVSAQAQGINHGKTPHFFGRRRLERSTYQYRQKFRTRDPLKSALSGLSVLISLIFLMLQMSSICQNCVNMRVFGHTESGFTQSYPQKLCAECAIA
jgi:hypothetical protein